MKQRLLLLLLLIQILGCDNDSLVKEERRVISKYSNGQEKRVIVVIDSLLDSIKVYNFFENSQLESEYSIVEQKIKGVYKLYYEKGGIKESGYYLGGEKNGKYYCYDTLGRLINQFVFYENEAVYKKSYFYDIRGDIDSTYEELGLIIDTNKESITDPFFINEYSAFGIKFPLDNMDKNGSLYIKYDLAAHEEGDTLVSYYPDSIDISFNSYSEIGYTFYEPCFVLFMAKIFQQKGDTTIFLGSFEKSFEVIDSSIYFSRQGINL